MLYSVLQLCVTLIELPVAYEDVVLISPETILLYSLLTKASISSIDLSIDLTRAICVRLLTRLCLSYFVLKYISPSR